MARSLRWLRARLLPRGGDTLMIAAYAILITALISFILQGGGLPAGRYYGTILSLSALLVLNVLWADLQAGLGQPRADRLYLSAAAALFLVANYLGLGARGLTFLPFVLFMISAQGLVSLGLRAGLTYVAGLTLGWFVVVWLRGADAANLLANLVSIGLGQTFTITMSWVLILYQRQTARAEGLAAELRAANQALAAAAERERELAAAEERVRLAREIHDGLGHHLTALNVQLQAAARLVGQDPGRAAAAIAICRDEAQAALREVRQSVAAMRGSPLDGRSLGQALAALVADFDRASPLRASFTPPAHEPELSPAAAMTLYRAAQEGLTNAQKHARATAVGVDLELRPAAALLRVHDDGAGGPPAAGGGFGLAGLRERAEQLGGRMAAGPGPAGGFVLEVEVPR